MCIRDRDALMRIHIGSDHAGLELKAALVEYLQGKGHVVKDHGPHEYDAVDDYPDFCIPAAIATVAALSLGSIGVASADHKGPAKSAAHDANRVANKAAHDAQHAAKEALVATTIGVDVATIKTRLAAGESLATIAGAKKDALIAALVAFKTKNIDAKVAEGKITATQATAMKANLTAHITEKVNAVGGKGMGPKGPKGPKGNKGHGPRH